MKRYLLLSAAATALLASPALAGERLEAGALSGELSANVALTTDYVFRGITQSDGGPAVQGGFDYATDIGFYIGTWASSIDFEPDAGESMEIDFYGGYANSFTIGGSECFDKGSLTAKTCGGTPISYDVGAIYYVYPQAHDAGAELDFLEIYGKLGIDFSVIAFETGVFYSPEFTGELGDATYYYGSATIPMPDGVLPVPVSIDGRIGYQEIDLAADYTEWEVGLNVTAFTLDWRVAYTDTDLSGVTAADSRVYGSVSKSW